MAAVRAATPRSVDNDGVDVDESQVLDYVKLVDDEKLNAGSKLLATCVCVLIHRYTTYIQCVIFVPTYAARSVPQAGYSRAHGPSCTNCYVGVLLLRRIASPR